MSPGDLCVYKTPYGFLRGFVVKTVGPFVRVQFYACGEYSSMVERYEIVAVDEF